MLLYYLFCGIVMFALHEAAIKFHPRVDDLRVHALELMAGHLGGVLPVIIPVFWLCQSMTGAQTWWTIFFGFASAGMGTGIGWAFDWIVLLIRERNILSRERSEWEAACQAGPDMT